MIRFILFISNHLYVLVYVQVHVHIDSTDLSKNEIFEISHWVYTALHQMSKTTFRTVNNTQISCSYKTFICCSLRDILQAHFILVSIKLLFKCHKIHLHFFRKQNAHISELKFFLVLNKWVIFIQFQLLPHHNPTCL